MHWSGDFLVDDFSPPLTYTIQAMAGSALEDTKLDAASALADLYIAQVRLKQFCQYDF